MQGSGVILSQKLWPPSEGDKASWKKATTGRTDNSF